MAFQQTDQKHSRIPPLNQKMNTHQYERYVVECKNQEVAGYF
jgi:hypothetical protein